MDCRSCQSNIIRLNSFNQAGFSLIELMIVIAIIGILATIAVPSYNTYIKKAKMVAVLNVLTVTKTYMLEYYQLNASCPPTLTIAGYTVSANQSMNINTQSAPGVTYISYWPNFQNTMCLIEIGVDSTLGGGSPSFAMFFDNSNTSNPSLFGCGFTWTSHVGSSSPYMPTSCSYRNMGSCNYSSMSSNSCL